jgi:hypothetical protein
MRVSNRLVVSKGRVSCPLRNTDVDVEHCLTCRSFRGTRSGNIRAGVIVCKTDLAAVLPSPSLYGPSYGTSVWRSR